LPSSFLQVCPGCRGIPTPVGKLSLEERGDAGSPVPGGGDMLTPGRMPGPPPELRGRGRMRGRRMRRGERMGIRERKRRRETRRRG
jgi:hypothetical protein